MSEKEPPRSHHTIRIRDPLWAWANAYCKKFRYNSVAQLIEEMLQQRQASDTPQLYVRTEEEGMMILPPTLVRTAVSRMARREWVRNQAKLYDLMDDLLTMDGVTRVVLFRTYPSATTAKTYVKRVVAESIPAISLVDESDDTEIELDLTSVAVLQAAMAGDVPHFTTAAMTGRLGQRFASLGSTHVAVSLVVEKSPRDHLFIAVHTGTKSPLDESAKGVIRNAAKRMKLHAS